MEKTQIATLLKLHLLRDYNQSDSLISFPDRVSISSTPKIPSTEMVTPIEKLPESLPPPPIQKLEPPIVQKVEETHGNRKKLEVVPPSPLVSFENSQWKEKLSSQFPELGIGEKRGLSVLILIDAEEKAQFSFFLENFVTAVRTHLSPCELLPIEKVPTDWESRYKLISGTKKTLRLFPNLRNHYRKGAESSDHFLGQIPLIFLEDLSLLSTQAEVKKKVWSNLKGALAL